MIANRIAKNRRELADIFGLQDESVISRYTQRGMPRLESGQYDIDACLSWRAANIRACNWQKKLIEYRARHEREKYLALKKKREQSAGDSIGLAELHSLATPILNSIVAMAERLEANQTIGVEQVTNAVQPASLLMERIHDKALQLKK